MIELASRRIREFTEPVGSGSSGAEPVGSG
jgi:hypothetical protein